MSDRHLTSETFLRFANRRATPQEASDTMQKLASDCAECKDIAAEAWEPTAAEPEAEFSVAAMDRILRQVVDNGKRLDSERRAAPALVAELMAHPQPRRLTMIRNSHRFRSWGLAELLVRECYERRFGNAEEGVALGELAVGTAHELDETAYRAALVADMRGRAWGNLGNARRVASDLAGAETALTEARRALLEGTGDPLERAELFLFLSSQRAAQRNFPQAIRYNKRATAAFAKLAEIHGVGRALHDRAAIHIRMADYATASELLAASLERLDGALDPRMQLMVRANLAYCLMHQDQLAAARAALAGLGPQFAAHGDSLTALRMRWMEGNLEVKAGNAAAAEAAYLEVRQGFANAQIAYDQALVSLDLAALYSEQHRTAEVRELAVEMVGVFQALQINREALAALILFQESVETETATIALVKELAAYLSQARSNPSLRFRE